MVAFGNNPPQQRSIGDFITDKEIQELLVLMLEAPKGKRAHAVICEFIIARPHIAIKLNEAGFILSYFAYQMEASMIRLLYEPENQSPNEPKHQSDTD